MLFAVALGITGTVLVALLTRYRSENETFGFYLSKHLLEIAVPLAGVGWFFAVALAYLHSSALAAADLSRLVRAENALRRITSLVQVLSIPAPIAVLFYVALLSVGVQLAKAESYSATARTLLGSSQL